jgi:hypothetical protein
MIVGPKAENGQKGCKIECLVSQNSKIDFNAISAFGPTIVLICTLDLLLNYFQNCHTRVELIEIRSGAGKDSESWLN